ncbi:phage holin family protein [Calidifontibacillus erzurumensis]|uniref:phage holin family protein n=1 Tax=Calidifontibacillus erzurumensis TaxID=2741433 RepID=UPI004041E5F1
MGGFLGWFLGGLDGFLYALIAFVAIDYVTGEMCVVVDRKVSGEVGAKGIFKKVLIFVLVGVKHIIFRQNSFEIYHLPRNDKCVLHPTLIIT